MLIPNGNIQYKNSAGTLVEISELIGANLNYVSATNTRPSNAIEKDDEGNPTFFTNQGIDNLTLKFERGNNTELDNANINSSIYVKISAGSKALKGNMIVTDKKNVNGAIGEPTITYMTLSLALGETLEEESTGGGVSTNYLKTITKDTENEKIIIKDQDDNATEFPYGSGDATYWGNLEKSSTDTSKIEDDFVGVLDPHLTTIETDPNTKKVTISDEEMGQTEIKVPYEYETNETVNVVINGTTVAVPKINKTNWLNMVGALTAGEPVLINKASSQQGTQVISYANTDDAKELKMIYQGLYVITYTLSGDDVTASGANLATNPVYWNSLPRTSTNPATIDQTYVAKVTSNNKVYGTNNSGGETTYGVAEDFSGGTIPVRTSSGCLKSGYPINNSEVATKQYVDSIANTKEAKSNKTTTIGATPSDDKYPSEKATKTYVDNAIADKVDKTTTAMQIYGTGPGTTGQTTYTISTTKTASSVAQRDSMGCLSGAQATINDNLVPLGQLNTELAKKVNWIKANQTGATRDSLVNSIEDESMVIYKAVTFTSGEAPYSNWMIVKAYKWSNWKVIVATARNTGEMWVSTNTGSGWSNWQKIRTGKRYKNIFCMLGYNDTAHTTLRTRVMVEVISDTDLTTGKSSDDLYDIIATAIYGKVTYNETAYPCSVLTSTGVTSNQLFATAATGGNLRYIDFSGNFNTLSRSYQVIYGKSLEI